PSISGFNWDFRFSRSLRFDGRAQCKINVEHTLAWPTNPALWGVGGHQNRDCRTTCPSHFDALRTVYGTEPPIRDVHASVAISSADAKCCARAFAGWIAGVLLDVAGGAVML